MTTQNNKPANFSRLYAIVKQLPGYQKGRDNEMIQAIIWNHTKEEKYKKSDLTMQEYTDICNVLCQKYGIKMQHKDRLVKSHNATDENDMWRKRVMAVINEWCILQGRNTDDAYVEDKYAYVKAIAVKAATENGVAPKTFNSIPNNKLRRIYNEFLHQNKISKTINKL